MKQQRYTQPKAQHRKRIGSNTLYAVRRAVEREAERHGVSMAYVITVNMADALGVPLPDEYRYAKARRVMATAMRMLQGGRR